MTVRQAFKDAGFHIEHGAKIFYFPWPSFYYGWHLLPSGDAVNVRLKTFGVNGWVDVDGWRDKLPAESTKDISNEDVSTYLAHIPKEILEAIDV